LIRDIGMSRIKKHQCPSCGGNLAVDNDKQLYHCSFCGSTYDYEYFREDEMHETGEKYLSRGEFMAAVDAYRFTLTKDPHDFFALRGLMLAAARLKDIDELVREKESDEDFSYDPKLVDEALEGASEEDREYFTELAGIYSDKKKLSDCIKEIESLGKEKRRISSTVTLKDESRYDYYVADKYGRKHSPKGVFILGWVAVGFFAAFTIYVIVALFELGTEGTGVLFGLIFLNLMTMGGITAINLGVHLRRIKKIEEIDRTIVMLNEEYDKLSRQKRKLGDEVDALSAKIRFSCHGFVKKDKQITGD